MSKANRESLEAFVAWVGTHITGVSFEVCVPEPDPGFDRSRSRLIGE